MNHEQRGHRCPVVDVRPGFPEGQQRTVHTGLLGSQNLMLCEIFTMSMANLKLSVNNFTQFTRGKEVLYINTQWKQCQTLFFWAPKSLQMVIAVMKLKDAYSLEGKL